MNVNWIFVALVPILLPNPSYSFTPEARIAEWSGEDEVKSILKIMSEGGDNTTDTANDSSRMHLLTKRLVPLDTTDKRKGFKVEATSFIRKFKRKPKLGDCTLGKHKYNGKNIYSETPRLEFKYSRKSGRLHSVTHSDVMGGIGISLFGIGASAKVRVATSIKRDSKSLLLYSHLVVHKGMFSLVNPTVGENWQSCANVDKHYYIRDILAGAEDYTLVQLRFDSEAKRKEVEVTVKLDLLFFSISKTIRKIKTETKTDFTMTAFRVTTFPQQREERRTFGKGFIEKGVLYVENMENERKQLPKNVNAVKSDDPRLHLEYFLLPCMIKTVVDSLPFKAASNFLILEFVKRVNEMESVLQDVRNAKMVLSGKMSSALERLGAEITKRLNKIGDWKNRKLSHNYVHQLLMVYGKDRAPYYYERQLYRIMKT